MVDRNKFESRQEGKEMNYGKGVEIEEFREKYSFPRHTPDNELLEQMDMARSDPNLYDRMRREELKQIKRVHEAVTAQRIRDTGHPHPLND